MKFTIQVLIEAADARPLTVPIQIIDRPCESIEEVGLQTREAKSIQRELQELVIRHQLGDTWPAKDLARIASDHGRSRATTRCDSGAPTVMCRYGAPDGIAVNASE